MTMPVLPPCICMRISVGMLPVRLVLLHGSSAFSFRRSCGCRSGCFDCIMKSICFPFRLCTRSSVPIAMHAIYRCSNLRGSSGGGGFSSLVVRNQRRSSCVA